MIVEAEISHDRPSASWTPKKHNGIIQSECKGLRASDRNPSLRTREDAMRCPTLSRRQKRGRRKLLCHHPWFYSGWGGLDGAHSHWVGTLFTGTLSSRANVIPRPWTDTPDTLSHAGIPWPRRVGIHPAGVHGTDNSLCRTTRKLAFWNTDSKGTEHFCGCSSTPGKDSHWMSEVLNTLLPAIHKYS